MRGLVPYGYSCAIRDQLRCPRVLKKVQNCLFSEGLHLDTTLSFAYLPVQTETTVCTDLSKNPGQIYASQVIKQLREERHKITSYVRVQQA